MGRLGAANVEHVVAALCRVARTRHLGQRRRCRRILEHEQLLPDPLLRSFQRSIKPLGAKWFEQIIHRVHFKRPQRVLIICRCKNNSDVVTDQLQHLKTIELRHLNIEEDQIRL